MRAVIAVLALLFAAGCTGTDNSPTNSEFVFVSPGGQTDITYDGADRKPLPELSGPSLMEPGTTLSLSDYRGKVVVLNVWGSWCPPCRVEAPELQKVQDEYGDKGVQVLGIAVRDFQETEPRDFMINQGLTYPSIYDPPGRSLLALKGYPRAVVPATFVIDKQGRVAAAFMRELLASDLEPILGRLVAE
ncbi:TlpA disulfide reductase family protein [Actinokineospora sp. UTMC 2448]|uniref:TlpA family protein disulfide reductase n=1 Tax=Actinokineospora sp. UTMC 2448 TaxID=2268449 RepID=UPI0021647EAC|nr:TlpA disulfide reductase family protein [Actinokineospora sp. UTMC 2448]UVS82289.1 Cytochrome c biogenesis protein CcmG [Actinokineospora sp. UTMC 2448]